MASQPSNAVATIPESAEAQRFGLMQRQARMFAMSPLVPEHLRKGPPEQAMANCYIAMTIADRMGEDRMTVMQNIHIVSGKAGFAAQYMIARANASGVFKGRIGWRIDKSDPKNLAVTAYATLAGTGEEVEFTCDMAMATAEGWTKNPKYRTMPEVMLRYRSATFLVRFYAPDVMLGYHTAEEYEDVVAAALPSAEPLTAGMLVDQSRPAEEVIDQVTGEVVDQAAADEPVSELEPTDDEDRDEFGLKPLPQQNADEQPQGETEQADKSDASPTAIFLVKIRGQIGAAKNASYLKETDEEWLKHRVSYDDATATEIDGLIAAKRRALSEGEGK